jgi:hypothetical protein
MSQCSAIPGCGQVCRESLPYPNPDNSVRVPHPEFFVFSNDLVDLNQTVGHQQPDPCLNPGSVDDGFTEKTCDSNAELLFNAVRKVRGDLDESFQ